MPPGRSTTIREQIQRLPAVAYGTPEPWSIAKRTTVGTPRVNHERAYRVVTRHGKVIVQAMLTR